MAAEARLKPDTNGYGGSGGALSYGSAPVVRPTAESRQQRR